MPYSDNDTEYFRAKRRAKAVPVGAAGQPDFKQGPANLAAPGTAVAEPPTMTTFPTADARVVASRLRSAGMRNLQYTPDRETRIQNRYDIEDQLRPLEQALAPQQRVPTPQGLEAATLALRSQLARARAERGMQDAVPLPNADVAAGQRAAYGTGAARPMTNPSDEMARQGMLSLAGREPVLSNNELTTPGDLVRRRRAFTAPVERPVEEVLPLPTPEGADRSITDAQTRNANIVRAQQATGSESATGVLERAASQRNFRREMGTKQQDVVRATLEGQADTARSAGIESRIKRMQLERELRGATPITQNPARIQDTLQKVTDLIPQVTNPGFGAQNPASQSAVIEYGLGDIEHAIPDMTPEQRGDLVAKLSHLRDSIQSQRSMWQRPEYSDKYVLLIQHLLSKLGG